MERAGAGPGAGWALALAALFVALHLGGAASLAGFHGDERFYTDATLEMAARGEWTLPRFGDGAPRFNKPLLAYWLIGGSFELFGVNPLAARLPFLLAMAGAVFVTYRLGLAALGDRRVALAAAALYAATSATTSTALRSTPDALQAFGVALASLGLVELLARVPPRGAAGKLWLGVGLTVAAKLGLGFLVAAFAVVAALLAGDDSRAGGLGRAARLRRLVHPLAVAPGLALALAGTLPMVLGHGDALRHSFDDQVGSRVPPGVGFVLTNLAKYAAAPLRHFAPFSVFALAALAAPWLRGRLRRTRQATEPAAIGGAASEPAHAELPLAPRRWHNLAFGFTLLLVAVFALGNLHRARYLLPAYPLVAVLLASALQRPSAGMVRALRVTAWLPVVLLTAVAAALVAREPHVARTAAAFAVGLAALARRSRGVAAAHVPVAATGLLVLTGFVASELRPAFHRTPVTGLLEALGPGAQTVVVFDPWTHDLADVASNLRVMSGGEVRAFTAVAGDRGLRAAFPPEALASPPVVALLTRADQAARELPGHTLVGAWPRQRVASPGAILEWALRGGPRPPHGDEDVLGLWLPR